jgi:hypothetical protein
MTTAADPAPRDCYCVVCDKVTQSFVSWYGVNPICCMLCKSIKQRKEVDQEQYIVLQANELARKFYELRGYCVPPGYRFDQSTHPHELEAWNQAVVAYDFIEGTDVLNALDNIDE